MAALPAAYPDRRGVAGDAREPESNEMNLKTDYLGLKLRTPLVPSASPLSESLDNIKRTEDAGASAIVLSCLVTGTSHFKQNSVSVLSARRSRREPQPGQVTRTPQFGQTDGSVATEPCCIVC